MATLSVRAAVKQVLTADPRMSVEEVIAQIAALGVKADPKAVRKSVHNQRTEIANAVKAKPVPAAARTTAGPKTEPASAAVPAPTPPAAANGPSDLGSVLANVALVNTVAGVCGGVAQARQVAEAVGACGGVEAFLKHLALIESIRGAS